jgi:excisionase family DNA binding protein
MTTLARTAPTPAVDSQVLKELRFVVKGLAEGLSARLTSLVEDQLAGKKVSTKAVERVVTANIPVLLEEEFIASLLVNKAADQQRAVLLHVLSTVQVQSLGLVGTASPLGVTATHEVVDDDELTSEAAAKLLHVSRSHLNTLADSGALGAIRRTAGNHRRISKTALLDYKKRSKERQAKGLDAMMEASQKLGLYDEEIADVPRRASR